MKKKIKLIISFIILIIGLILIILAIVKSKDDNLSNNKLNHDTSETKMIYQFSNFLIDNSNRDEIALNLDIKNNTENSLNKNKMYLKFYQKKDILYTYEYDIPELNPYDMISLGVTLNFEYDNITKYEIIIGNLTKEITPVIINKNS